MLDKSTEKNIDNARDEIIWDDGSWSDPALLDWKRCARCELSKFTNPAKGSRTIKNSYTPVVTTRGP